MCQKCGKCCHRGDFWQLSKHPMIVEFAYNKNLNKINSEGVCLMLDGTDCMIEKYLGKSAKPEVCNAYDCSKKTGFDN